MNEDQNDRSASESSEQKFRVEIDPQVEQSLQGGLDALGKVFGGLVNSIKDAVGPELMRSMEVANWLEQLATCLDGIAGELRSSGSASWESVGQLDFYVDQFDAELQDTKLADRQAALREHLDSAHAAVKQVTPDNAVQQADQIAKAAGYFRAAARSLVPIADKSGQSD